MAIYNAEDRLPVLGQTVVGYNIPAASDYSGKQGVVTRAEITGVTAEFTSIAKPDDTISLSFMEWSPAYAVGDKVHVTYHGSDLHGKHAVIDRPDGLRTGYWWVKDCDSDNVGLVYEGNMEWVPADGSTLSTSDPAPNRLGRDGVVVPADATPSQLLEIIERLSNDLADEKHRYELANSTLNTRNQQFSDSINVIGKALMEEAERRGWCSEYDEFVESINSQLPFHDLPTREREYEVTWTESYIVRVDRSVTYTAKSPEEAEDLARDEYEDGALVADAVRNGEYERMDDYCEYEVEEV
jgi:hypothetical protein